MPLQCEQFVEISPYRPAREVPVLPSSEIGIQSTQRFSCISVHPSLGQPVRFRDAITVDLKFGEAPLRLFGPFCINRG